MDRGIGLDKRQKTGRGKEEANRGLDLWIRKYRTTKYVS
jgi:hypothetical protein